MATQKNSTYQKKGCSAIFFFRFDDNFDKIHPTQSEDYIMKRKFLFFSNVLQSKKNPKDEFESIFLSAFAQTRRHSKKEKKIK